MRPYRACRPAVYRCNALRSHRSSRRKNSRPVPTAKVDTIPAARDIAFPGTMQLTVDRERRYRAIFEFTRRSRSPARGTSSCSIQNGSPGGHSPRKRHQERHRLSAQRQRPPAAVEARHARCLCVHIMVPAGVSSIDVDFQYVTPTDNNQGRIWRPPTCRASSGCPTRCIRPAITSGTSRSRRRLIVPSGWKVATALRPSGECTGPRGSRVDYPVTSYEILVDSPLIAGAHYRKIPLTADVTLDVIAIVRPNLLPNPSRLRRTAASSIRQ